MLPEIGLHFLSCCIGSAQACPPFKGISCWRVGKEDGVTNEEGVASRSLATYRIEPCMWGQLGFVACSSSSVSRDHFDEGVREGGCRGMDSGCLDMRGVDVLEVSRRKWKGRDLITYDL